MTHWWLNNTLVKQPIHDYSARPTYVLTISVTGQLKPKLMAHSWHQPIHDICILTIPVTGQLKPKLMTHSWLVTMSMWPCNCVPMLQGLEVYVTQLLNLKKNDFSGLGVQKHSCWLKNKYENVLDYIVLVTLTCMVHSILARDLAWSHWPTHWTTKEYPSTNLKSWHPTGRALLRSVTPTTYLCWGPDKKRDQIEGAK